MRVDAQVHVVSPDRERYPLRPPDPALTGAMPHWYDAPGIGADDLLGRMDVIGVDRVVLVQALSAYGYDNSYTADAAQAHPDRMASTCAVDAEHEPLPAIEHWVTERGAGAIRIFARVLPEGWLTSPAGDEVLGAVGAAGAVAQLVASADQLPALLEAAGQHPELPVVLDHCGLPDLSGGPSYPNAAGLFAPAAAPNVHLKLSSHVYRLAREGGSNATELTERLVEAFGAGRIMWASDYSVLRLVFEDCVREAEEACAGLSDTDRDLVLGGTAAALWWP